MWGDVDHARTRSVSPAVGDHRRRAFAAHARRRPGHLTRHYGLTIDNLLAVDIVRADGRMVTANAKEHSDLFWAVRGGGGNFGVVTSFLFKAHPVHTNYAGPMLWPLEDAAEAMRWYRKFLVKAPPVLNGFFAFLTVPPGPPFPEHLHLKKMCGIVWCYSGPMAKAEAVFRPIRAFKKPALDLVGPIPHPALQAAFDGCIRWPSVVLKTDFFRELSDKAIAPSDTHRVPTMHRRCTCIRSTARRRRSGTQLRRGATATTWPVSLSASIGTRRKRRISAGAKEYWTALHPHSAGGAYVNFMMDDGEDRVKATYGGNYAKLAKIKKKYDPNNFFRVNQNIRPK